MVEVLVFVWEEEREMDEEVREEPLWVVPNKTQL